jgi:hypothetical protein
MKKQKQLDFSVLLRQLFMRMTLALMKMKKAAKRKTTMRMTNLLWVLVLLKVW